MTGQDGYCSARQELCKAIELMTEACNTVLPRKYRQAQSKGVQPTGKAEPAGPHFGVDSATLLCSCEPSNSSSSFLAD